MKKMRWIFLALAALACLLTTGCGGDDATYFPIVSSSKFVYVNNNTDTTNYVSAFAIKAGGTLEELAGSPYATGGAGNEFTYYASNPIAIASTKQLLFASNKADSTISVFGIDPDTGALTAIDTPVASGGTMDQGGSLAVDADENYLFVGNDATNNIAVFAIAADGTLTAVTGSPFDIGTPSDGMTLNAVGSLLYVAAPDTNAVIVLDIAADGSLTPITGSPFAYPGAGTITSFTLASSTLGLSGAVGGELTSYLIATDGTPTAVETVVVGTNAQCITTNSSGRLAFLSGGNDDIHVVRVSSNGTLTPVTGSPFATSWYTSGYAVPNSNASLLFVTEEEQIEVFRVSMFGTLSSIGTYPLTNPGYTTGLVVY